jgi:hypothetical protein
MKTRKAQKQGNGGIKIEVEIGGEDSAPAGGGGGVCAPSELLVPRGTARWGS